MWSDNETSLDLLGFRVHADLIRSVITDPTLLPVTVGVFGDWGSGKSSVMRMIMDDLKDSDNVAVIYFNGWQFEGYDDAKSALIYSILLELSEHAKVSAQVKNRIKKLWDSIDWLRVGSVGYQVLAPLATGFIASQTGVPSAPMMPPAPAPSTSAPQDQLGSVVKEKIEEIDLADLVEKNPAYKAVVGARKLRDQFTQLIKETNLAAVVILVDDLDRCDSKRLVETLEAIKLFLAVPHVAFVIGADERIMRYAIAKRYELESIAEDSTGSPQHTDLVTDYLEKLIQVPYYLPRLSQSEIETYMSLLFCQRHLGAQFELVCNIFRQSRKADITATFGLQDIQTILIDNGMEAIPELNNQLVWCSKVASALGDTLKGNPRQTKRLLNALTLRQKLAQAAHMDQLDDQVLVKLMLLQYLQPLLFAQLYKWQQAAKGKPQQLNQLEEWAQSEDTSLSDELKSAIEQKMTWTDLRVRRWLSMHPSLKDVDLRPYFWVTRDRVTNILSGISTIPRHLRILISELSAFESDSILVPEVKQQLIQLAADEQNILLEEFGELLRRAEDKTNLIAAWAALSEVLPTATDRFLGLLERIPTQTLPVSTPSKLELIALGSDEYASPIIILLERWSQEKTVVGRAAKESLESLRRKLEK